MVVVVVAEEEVEEQGLAVVEEEEVDVEEDVGGGQKVKEGKAEEKGDLTGERQSGDGQVRGHDLEALESQLLLLASITPPPSSP